MHPPFASRDEPLAAVLMTHYFPAKGGGVEIVAGELAGRLTATESVCLTWFASDTEQAPRLPGVQCRPVRAWDALNRYWGVPWPVWTPFCISALWRAIGAADVVHLHDSLYMGNILAAVIAKCRGKPIIVTQHIGLIPYRSALARGLMGVGNRLVAKPLLQGAECVVFISESVRAYFNGLCRWRTQPHFVPNGVDTQLFRVATQPERRAARQALGLPEASPVLIFVGRFVEKKGLLLLRRLAALTPELTWLIAGEGRIDPERWGLGNVRVYRGRRRESLRELLWAADLLVLPSVGEGFPLVVQEATACGLSSLVSAATLAGYPEAQDMILSEPLGFQVEERWVSRLQAFFSGTAARPDCASLQKFAQLHWSWQKASSFYANQFAALTDRKPAR